MSYQEEHNRKYAEDLKEYNKKQQKEAEEIKRRERESKRIARQNKRDREAEIRQCERENEKRKHKEEERLRIKAWLNTPEGRVYQAHQENDEKRERDKQYMTAQQIEERDKARLHALTDGRPPYTYGGDPKKRMKKKKWTW